MVEQDTIRLLRECDAGIRMGVSSIKDVIDYVKSEELRASLARCAASHEKLGGELRQMLDSYHDGGKAPNPVAKSMSWVKTGVMMSVDRSDETISDLMTDGCNMGVKSLSRYLNRYKAADERSKDVAKRLIKLEDDLAHEMRAWL